MSQLKNQKNELTKGVIDLSVNVLNEYKQHNEFLIEQVKEKNKENNELRRKVALYEQALKYISEIKQPDGGYVSRLDVAISKARLTLQD